MSPNAARIEEIVAEIRRRLRLRSHDLVPAETQGFKVGVSQEEIRHAAAVLARLDDDIAAAGEKIGSCPPSPNTFRARAGNLVIRALSKLFWWQHFFIKNCVKVIVRRNREQTRAFERLNQAVADLANHYLRVSTELERIQKALAEVETRCQLLVSREEYMTRLEAASSDIRNDLFQKEQRYRKDLERISSANTKLVNETADLRSRIESMEAVADLVPSRYCSFSEGTFADLYSRFEDRFRGTRAEIKERQRIYLPTLHEAGAGSKDMPILDLGCGRGEWLELLAEHHLVARGVDANRAMFERCRTLGLDVELGDAFSHIRELPDGSYGAITSFHMIEHLPFDTVIKLIVEAHRVLKPRGLLILETPNPGNLGVGASGFYMDPTHVRPIPSRALMFFVEACGFNQVELRELHPYNESERLPVGTDGVATRFNELFYGPQDYALIARKP